MRGGWRGPDAPQACVAAGPSLEGTKLGRAECCPMHVRRIADAESYEPERDHYDMCGLRLQGAGVSPAAKFWVGLSHFLPGGGAETSQGEVEKVYVVLNGTLTVSSRDSVAELSALDSCHLAAGEPRRIENRTTMPASMLVVMPTPSER